MPQEEKSESPERIGNHVEYATKHKDSTLDEYLVAVGKQRGGDGFSCRRCGRCCLHMSNICLFQEDLERWEREGREDLCSKRMEVEWSGFSESRLFRNRTSCRCPFLRKERNKDTYICKINHTKPTECRIFPISKEHELEVGWGCPGYD